MRVAKRRVIKRMSEMIVTETNRQLMTEAIETLQRKELFEKDKVNEIKHRVLL